MVMRIQEKARKLQRERERESTICLLIQDKRSRARVAFFLVCAPFVAAGVYSGKMEERANKGVLHTFCPRLRVTL